MIARAAQGVQGQPIAGEVLGLLENLDPFGDRLVVFARLLIRGNRDSRHPEHGQGESGHNQHGSFHRGLHNEDNAPKRRQSEHTEGEGNPQQADHRKA